MFVIVGAGFMGRLFLRMLEPAVGRDCLAVVDHRPLLPASADPYRPLRQYDSLTRLAENHPLTAVFICTPSRTHCKVATEALALGCRSLYIEKPAAMNRREYNELVQLANKVGAKVVVGYQLRHSRAYDDLYSEHLARINQGWHPTSIRVRYTKDKRDDPRRFSDIGVFEEVPHVLELLAHLFDSTISEAIEGRVLACDSDIARRVTSLLLHADSRLDTRPTLSVFSSFESSVKDREFRFDYSMLDGQHCTLVLSFDNGGRDILRVVQADDQIIRTYPSDEKLLRLLTLALEWFQCRNDKPNTLHTLEDSDSLTQRLEDLLSSAEAQRTTCDIKSA